MQCLQYPMLYRLENLGSSVGMKQAFLGLGRCGSIGRRWVDSKLRTSIFHLCLGSLWPMLSPQTRGPGTEDATKKEVLGPGKMVRLANKDTTRPFLFAYQINNRSKCRPRLIWVMQVMKFFAVYLKMYLDDLCFLL